MTITAEQIEEIRELVRDYNASVAGGVDVWDLMHTCACNLANWAGLMLYEIERLRAGRPSCSTCRWAKNEDNYGRVDHDDVFCEACGAVVTVAEMDGVCLWEAK